MIKALLSILALQIVFGSIIALAVFMGSKADARCKKPSTWKVSKTATPWAPAWRCEPR